MIAFTLKASSAVHANEEVFGWLWRFPVAKFGAARFVGFHWQKMDRQDSRREADRSVGGQQEAGYMVNFFSKWCILVSMAAVFFKREARSIRKILP